MKNHKQILKCDIAVNWDLKNGADKSINILILQVPESKYTKS